MTIKTVYELLERCREKHGNFPPTDLYNEGWMLRLVLEWLSRHPGVGGPLAFAPSDRWYCEALLPTAFRPDFRGDPLSEARTHADGVIGDFQIGADRKGDLTALDGASRLLIVEAKMNSKLSSGVKNAPFFNQAARNVACLAEVMAAKKVRLTEGHDLGFFVLAPRAQIEAGVFRNQLDREHIRQTVQRRVAQYEGRNGDGFTKRKEWFETAFEPTLEMAKIQEIAWEEVLDMVADTDSAAGQELKAFYEDCKRFN